MGASCARSPPPPSTPPPPQPPLSFLLGLRQPPTSLHFPTSPLHHYHHCPHHTLPPSLASSAQRPPYMDWSFTFSTERRPLCSGRLSLGYRILHCSLGFGRGGRLQARPR